MTHVACDTLCLRACATRSEMKMQSALRWSLRLILIIVVAAFSSFVTAFYMSFRPHPQISLTRDLAPGKKGTWDEVSAGFDNRLKSRFPIGSTESIMSKELRKEGFTRDDWQSDIDSEHEAVRREDNWVCNQAAHVYWRADTSGLLSAIRGIYRAEGCL